MGKTQKIGRDLKERLKSERTSARESWINWIRLRSNRVIAGSHNEMLKDRIEMLEKVVRKLEIKYRRKNLVIKGADMMDN